MDYKKRFLHYLKPQKGRVVLTSFLVLVFVLAQLSTPFLVGKALDSAIALDWNLFIIYIIICYSLAFIGVLAGYFFEYNVGVLSQNLIKKMRDDVFNKLTHISVSDVHNDTKGNLVQLEIGDIENVANGIFSVFKSLIEGVLTVIITIVIMFVINWMLAIGVILLTPISVIVARFIARFSKSHFKEQARLQSKLSAISYESLTNSELVQSYNYQNEEKKAFEKQNDVLYDHGRIALFSASWVNPTTRLVNNFIYAIIGVGGILLFILTLNNDANLTSLNGLLTIGGLGSFLSYTNQYGKPFNEISGVVAEYETAVFSFKRINDFLNKEDEVNLGSEKISDISSIEFSHMDFSYDPSKKLIIGFNQSIQKGQKIAIVGPTGAGKTTLINVLMNFYAPLGGDILYNHISQKSIEKKSLRSNFGMVLQETWIFSGTVLDNVRYAKPSASDEEVIEACKRAHADTFINTLPKGYYTYISSKEGLSDGERQMLTIARVMLVEPDIVILDEATSNVDTRSEKLINDAFDKMMKGRTSIVIAHRLSTIQSADVILVLKDGHIIEQGTHKSLMAKKGFYYSMYSSQFD